MGRLQSVLGFQPIPVSTVLFLIYVAVWLSVYITDQLPAIPVTAINNVNITEALLDLQHIASRPHPYNSHANDDVLKYLRQTIAERHPDIEIEVDTKSSGKWVGSTVIGVPAVASYFEGNNILVRIPGTLEKNTPGVLFSAHYDSVSTAPGVTDDGIGICTALQLISYFRKHPPNRTVIFNINNGEEDGLHGARAFLLHPWASEVNSFVNLEGAAAGGPVLPFRVTGEDIMRAYRKGANDYHANVLSADAFERGMIRSGTDYQVYIEKGMRGIDFAFYRGRTRYHTKYDALAWTEGRERAIWNMMQAALGTGIALVNENNAEATASTSRKGVWFDLFGKALFLVSLDSMWTFNVVALVVGPITLLLLLALQVTVSRKLLEEQGHGRVSKSTPVHRALWTSLKYWVGLAAVIGAQVGWVVGWVQMNKYMIHTYPYTLMASSFTLSLLVFTLVVNIPIPGQSAAADRQLPPSPLPLLLHTYLLTYILLIVSTVAITKFHVSGTYLITAWNALVWAGCVVGIVIGKGGLLFAGKQKVIVSPEVEHSDGEDQDEELSGTREDRPSEENEDATERTPLLSDSRSGSRSPVQPSSKVAEPQTTYTWIPLLLIATPFPLILLSQTSLLLVGALAPTIADGSSPIFIHVIIAAVAGVAGSFSWPFVVSSSNASTGFLSGGLHRYLIIVLSIVFVLTTLPGWLAGGLFNLGTTTDRGVQLWTEGRGLYPPFTTDSPLKVYFQQTLRIVPSHSSTSPAHLEAETTLTGVGEFLERWVTRRLPSARDATCSGDVDSRKRGLLKCSWPSGAKGLLPTPGGDEIKKEEIQKEKWDWVATSNTWFDARARSEIFSNVSESGARISILGRNTRNCRVYFDQPVLRYRVSSGNHEDTWDMQGGIDIPADTGLNEVRLWSRDWGKRQELDVIWKDGSAAKRTGRVACEWAEFESGMVGLSGHKSSSKIPAYEEVLSFLPRWAVASKLSDGLVEVSEEFNF
ncbi:hypothetical protein AAF712_007125 [Marasmius tenuissimus]|uniref:Peptide hydrolase n=1 Tax=Marasmius tenuissimus TaxID=585030 RepID=A0ABR2ZVV9_9AGAR